MIFAVIYILLKSWILKKPVFTLIHEIQLASEFQQKHMNSSELKMPLQIVVLSKCSL